MKFHFIVCDKLQRTIIIMNPVRPVSNDFRPIAVTLKRYPNYTFIISLCVPVKERLLALMAKLLYYCSYSINYFCSSLFSLYYFPFFLNAGATKTCPRKVSQKGSKRK